MYAATSSLLIRACIGLPSAVSWATTFPVARPSVSPPGRTTVQSSPEARTVAS